MSGSSDRDELLETAKDVLEGNQSGQTTKPSPDLYPHQWMWDSCFISIGISRYDPERAQNELRALLRAQWSNGMLPQIIFNPDSTGYFPGPDTWRSRESPYAPRDVETSGITQPPMPAIAALAAYRRDPNRERAEAFGREVYPKIRSYHEFLYRERDPDGSGLVVVVHPWESGLDNSPPYLDAGSRVHLTYKPQYTRLDTRLVAASHRPSDKDYDLFVWLLEQMRAVKYDWPAYLRDATLQVEDVLFNAILCKANDDLQELADDLGIVEAEEDGQPISPFAQKGTREALVSRLWDEDASFFFGFDRVAGRLLTDVTIAGLMPLLCLSPDSAALLERLANALGDPERFGSGSHQCATTAFGSKWFNPENYWLGPVWINTNWLLCQGLRHGTLNKPDMANRLSHDAVELVTKSGFREYFNPTTGEGYGTSRFSWSAALTIDLLSEGQVAPGDG